MNNDKPVFQPREGAGAAINLTKMREALMSKKEQIKKMICEEGDLKGALALAGSDVEEAIRRAIKIADDADDEGRSSSGGAGCSIDFGEIARAAEKMTNEQIDMLILIAGLLKGIFSMPVTTDSLDFISM